MCRTCFEKTRGERPESVERPRRPQPGPATWTIRCVSCGGEDSVPFEPRPGSEVFCKACHEKRKEKQSTARKYSRRGPNPAAPSIPRLDHGTRVFYPIVCQKCGKEEVLAHVPRVNGEVMCTDCAAERHGKTWYQVKLAAEAEKAEHTIECATCGRTDTIPFKPAPNRKYHCRRCLDDEAQPNRDRLEGFEPVDKFMKVRRG